MFFDATKQFDSRETMRKFRDGLLPWLEKNGQRVGERAMQGDADAENIIRRYAIFCAWQDPVNLSMLENQVRDWKKKVDA